MTLVRPFIPVRSGAGILIFEHREIASQARWEFHAVAWIPAPGEPIRRTGVAALDDKALEDCAKAAATLPAMDNPFGEADLLDGSTAGTLLDADRMNVAISGSPLLTASLYLEFLRQSLVHETAIRRYENSPPETRVVLGLSASVLDGLLKRHALERAEALIDADVPHAPTNARGREWAHYFRLCAAAKERLDKPADTEAMLLRAVKAAPAQGTWRRIGLLREARGDKAAAVEAFEAAERLQPLDARPTLRLAWWLHQLERHDEAKKWAETASARGATDADKLLELLSQPE